MIKLILANIILIKNRQYRPIVMEFIAISIPTAQKRGNSYLRNISTFIMIVI